MYLFRLALASLANRRFTALLTIFAIALSACLLLAVERVRTEAKASFASTISGTDLIVGARAEEFVALLKKSLRMLGVHAETRPATYLTGGGFSMMRGGGEYLRQQLGLHVKRDMPYMPDMNTPNYASAFGALDFALRASSAETEESVPIRQGIGGILDRIRNLFIQ